MTLGRAGPALALARPMSDEIGGLLGSPVPHGSGPPGTTPSVESGRRARGRQRAGLPASGPEEAGALPPALGSSRGTLNGVAQEVLWRSCSRTVAEERNQFHLDPNGK